MVFALAIALVGLATPALAQQNASQFISQLADRAIAMLKETAKSGPAVREQRFREMFHENFDVSVMGQYVLGGYWQHASDAQRQSYLAQFEAFLVHAYARELDDYGGETLEVGQTTQDGDGYLVEGQIMQVDGDPPSPIVFRLVKRGESFKIVDVKVEGVSLGMTQRSDFTSFLRQNNGDIDALIARLHQMTAAK